MKRLPKTLLLVVGLVVLFGTNANSEAVRMEPQEVQSRLERMARTYSYFSLTVIIYNRELGIGAPRAWKENPLVSEQNSLVNDLRALGSERDALAKLLKHSDPRVRTLALGALYEREDGRDLPLIAALEEDTAETFQDIHEPLNMNRMGPHPLSELVSPFTVGKVAKEMVRFWIQNFDARDLPPFADYWQRHGNRDHYASWFVVKMNRATRQTTPIQPAYRRDIQRVLEEMNALPSPDREWTKLYVLCTTDESAKIVPDQELVAAAKRLGRDAILRFLEHQPVSDDPDLNLKGEENGDYARLIFFFLSHADQFLRPQDAEALLEHEKRESRFRNPMWIIGRAMLLPARADEILQKALTDEATPYALEADALAWANWQISGPSANEFLVDWFYRTLAKEKGGDELPVLFLYRVEVSARPDTRRLLAALVKDPRFELVDLDVLRHMVDMANVGRPTPFVNEQGLYDPDNGEKSTLAKWRDLLRRECAVHGG